MYLFEQSTYTNEFDTVFLYVIVETVDGLLYRYLSHYNDHTEFKNVVHTL